MSSKLVSSIALTACLLASGAAFADVLYEQAPTVDATGLSANLSGDPLLTQTIPSLGSVTLDKINWWGYRDPVNDPFPAEVESFEVYLNGSVVAGVLSSSVVGSLPNTSRSLLKYTLDVTDAPLTATEIGVTNVNDFVGWFWQGAGVDAAGAPLVAFSLEGTRNGGVVPEPGMLAMLGLAGLALRAASRKRA